VMPVLEPEPGRQTHAADHERAALWDRAGGDDDEPDPGVDSKP
jgi:hypothetical protein